MARERNIPHEEAVKALNRLQAIKKAIQEKKAELNPVFYGLPDLLFPKGYAPGTLNSEWDFVRELAFPDETADEYAIRQNIALEDMISDHLRVARDGAVTEPVLIPEMVELISDLFFGRVRKAILWANRGGGKSLVTAIVIWLIAVYKKKSFVCMAGTGEQAKRVYEYTAQFWDCAPGLKNGMLEDDPLLKLTRMKGKTKIICCSGEQAVGEHLPGFVTDEACTDRPGAEDNIRRAMQGVFDNEDYLVLMLSTFHHPVGLFADHWDNAEALGFKQYRWNIYDTMEQCSVGMETATKDDPHAQKFCTTQCPLSRLEDKKDEHERPIGRVWKGCCGSGRTSQGWQTRGQVIAKFEANRGTRIFPVEHECERPRHEGLIYAPEVIDACVVPGFRLDTTARKVVGIDWGLTQCFMVCLGEWIEEFTNKSGALVQKRGLGVIATRVMSNKLTREVIRTLRLWQGAFGDDILIRADHSHPYCNMELREERFVVKTVRGDKDKRGEDNMARWLASGLFKISEEHTLLVTQLKGLRRDEDGKQVKENKEGELGDHGPDACKFALMAYDYVKWLRLYGDPALAALLQEMVTEDDD